MDENIDLQQHPGATVKVMTPHQLSALVFGTPGHEAIALDIRGRDVILDEIHTFSEASQRMVIQIIRALIGHGCRIHIGTATLPGKLADHLVELLGGASMVYQVSLKPEQLDRFDRHIIHKTYQQEEIGEEQAFQILRQAVSEKEKVLLVANRVATAQAWYWKIKKDPELSRYPLVLIHSRYRRQDRSQLEREIVAVQKPDFDGPAIAVSTQVVEVSLDISFDRMITQAAPLDALIQRFGRVNRRRSDETIGKYKPIHVMSVPEKERDVRPYYLETVRRSYDVLPDGDLLKERDVQRLINRVFPDLLIPEPHYAYIIGAEGTYRIRKLQHQPRSTIVEVLQIEGATCVLNREIEAYRKAPFDKKPLFEIPVPENFNRWNRLPIEPTGSYPFILPEERYQFTEDDKRGLIRDEDVPVHLQIN